MQFQKQTQPLVESEEFLTLLSEEEQAIIAGGEGKHRKPESKHAKPTSLLRRGLGIGARVASKAVPGLGAVSLAYDAYEFGNWALRKW